MKRNIEFSKQEYERLHEEYKLLLDQNKEQWKAFLKVQGSTAQCYFSDEITLKY